MPIRKTVRSAVHRSRNAAAATSATNNGPNAKASLPNSESCGRDVFFCFNPSCIDSVRPDPVFLVGIGTSICLTLEKAIERF
jgi:hypothetical protein